MAGASSCGGRRRWGTRGNGGRPRCPPSENGGGKWCCPQQLYDRRTGTAFLLLSRETSPPSCNAQGEATMGVAFLRSTDRGQGYGTTPVCRLGRLTLGHFGQDLTDDVRDQMAVIGIEGQRHPHVEGIGKALQCPRKLLNLA